MDEAVVDGRRIETKQYAIETLIEAEYNPRQLTHEAARHLKDSIKRFGVVDPILVNVHPDRRNIIIGGHQRVKVLEEMGITEVPCIELSLTLERERELNIRLNKNTGQWDMEALANNFDIEELTNWGFEEDFLTGFKEDDDFETEFDGTDDSNCEYPLVPKYSEKHDAIIIVSDNEIDTAYLKTALGLGKSKSYKNQATGEAMVVTARQFQEVWELRGGQGNAGTE